MKHQVPMTDLLLPCCHYHAPRFPARDYPKFTDVNLHTRSHLRACLTRTASPILMARLFRPRRRDDFEVVIICALSIERDAVKALVEESVGRMVFHTEKLQEIEAPVLWGGWGTNMHAGVHAWYGSNQCGYRRSGYTFELQRD